MWSTMSLQFRAPINSTVLAVMCLLGTLMPSMAAALNENCVVAVLNRTVQVKPDGTWLLPNVPAGFGPVKARATCIFNGVTTSGESAYFVVNANGAVDLPPIVLGSSSAVPTALTVTSPVSNFTAAGQTSQLTVIATYPNGSQQNVSAAPGTAYTVSNPALATVSPTGLVTAKASGTVIAQALNEGRPGIVSLTITLTGDRDGDGIPDDVEIRLGLDPNNPADALLDPDGDGLNNRDEVKAGTEILNPDTDGDGLSDGDEVNKFRTNPLVKDTDGDGVPDKIEIDTGSDPNNANSFNLAQALARITVAPSNFIISVNSVVGSGFQQLTVTGEFKAGGTIDLTRQSRGTNFASSNLTVCNFGAEDGRVFGGSDGACAITVTNSGFSAQASGVVRGFSPTASGFVDISGFANAVAVNGSFAYVASGGTGLQVVNVSNKAAPVVVGAWDSPGNGNGVDVAGNFAYLADGVSGLQIINISNPAAPTQVGTIATNGEAKDVVVRAGRAYVANGSSGLAIINVSNPAAPVLLGSVDTPGQGKGVTVDLARNLAVVADGTGGLQIINILNAATPAIIGSTTTGLTDARDVSLSGQYAIVADYNNSMTSIDLRTPSSPLFLNSTTLSLGGRLNDVVVSGNLAIGADVFFVNGVPIIDVSTPSALAPRSILNFSGFGDYDGQGISADATFLYMVGVSGSAFIENGVNGSSRLFIGQYLAAEDKNGIPPTVSIASPASGSSTINGTIISVTVNATDDVQVAGVALFANGVQVSVDTSAPYEFTVATTSLGPLVLQARAFDLGNNIGLSGNVTVNVVPDPLTLVKGRVLNQGTPVAGADIKIGSLTGVSGADGTFSIPSVPTINGNIIVTASKLINGKALRGSSTPVSPVVGGQTVVGDIALKGGKVGLLHCDSAVSARNALVNSGQIANDDIVELPFCGTPTLAALQEISAVLVWSNNSFPDGAGVGNVLADYADQGGGVVLATYVFSSYWQISGRIMAPNYSPFLGTYATIIPASYLNLSSPTNSAHPIMQGVSPGPYFVNGNYSAMPLNTGGTVIAYDANGNRSVGINPTQKVVGVAIFPGFGDMGRLFANALNYVR